MATQENLYTQRINLVINYIPSHFGLAPRAWDRRSPLCPDLKNSKNCEVHEPLIWYTDEMLAAVAVY